MPFNEITGLNKLVNGKANSNGASHNGAQILVEGIPLDLYVTFVAADPHFAAIWQGTVIKGKTYIFPRGEEEPTKESLRGLDTARYGNTDAYFVVGKKFPPRTIPVASEIEGPVGINGIITSIDNHLNGTRRDIHFNVSQRTMVVPERHFAEHAFEMAGRYE